MREQVLCELCAGSASVSLRWLSSGGKPPLGYQGSKRAYAGAILAALGLQPGRGKGHDVVLVEPGPWGEAWALWRTAAGRRDTCDRLRAWAGEDPRALWERLKATSTSSDAAERVATWAVLQFWGFARKPVMLSDGAWCTHGFNATEAYGSTLRAGYVAPNGGNWHIPDRRLPEVIAALERLPDISRVQVLTCDAVEVEPFPGAIVYLDPPYHDTSGYGCIFPRAAVLDVAERWRVAGCVVAVSEAEPLPLDGWHHHRLPPPHVDPSTVLRSEERQLPRRRPRDREPLGLLARERASPSMGQSVR